MGRMLNPDALQRPGNNPAGVGARKLPVAASKPFKSPVLARPSAPLVDAAAAVNAGRTAVQRMAFLAGIATIFVKITVLSELLVTFLHVNTYLLWIVGPPALFGTILAGGIGRTLRHPSARLFLGFFLCVAISLPFSSWVGGSVTEFKNYFENCFAMLFVVAGLTVTWSEVRTTFLTMGAAGVVIIAAGRLLAGNGDSGRLSMSGATGTIGNENDLASHLIFVLPFVLYIALDKRINQVLRFLMIFPMAYGVWMIFATASRGGLLSIAACFLFVLFRGAPRQRTVALILVVLMIFSVPLLVRGSAIGRLSSLFGGDDQEALESKEARSYLLRQSINYTISHPVFGVGLDQFPNYEGKQSIDAGVTGNWHETHNSFTQVSSECGIPAFIFFVLAIGSALAAVNRVYKRARREGFTEIANASFCYLLSMAGYLTSIVFLSNAYRYYLPIMIGLAIALATTAEREMSARGIQVPTMPAPFRRPIPARPRMVPS